MSKRPSQFLRKTGVHHIDESFSLVIDHLMEVAILVKIPISNLFLPSERKILALDSQKRLYVTSFDCQIRKPRNVIVLLDIGWLLMQIYFIRPYSRFKFLNFVLQSEFSLMSFDNLSSYLKLIRQDVIILA